MFARRKSADKILFDPGKFSFNEGKVKPNQFENLSAIILTHCHPDHIDDGYVKDFFLKSRYQTLQKFLKKETIEFLWMSSAGEFIEVEN